jgi:hypothetical protein
MNQPEHETPPRVCMRCGRVGTHSLRCPSLQLRPGYRIAGDPRSEEDAEPYDLQLSPSADECLGDWRLIMVAWAAGMPARMRTAETLVYAPQAERPETPQHAATASSGPTPGLALITLEPGPANW